MSGFVVGAVIGGVMVGGLTAIAIGAVVGYVVGDFIMDSLTPDAPDVDAGTQGAMTNKASSNDPIPIIYGERRIGATKVFVETSGTDNQYLYQVLILGEGEIDSVTEVFIDDESLVGSKYESFITYTIHTGTESQTADSDLVAASSVWTSAHQLKGTAYAYVRLEYDQDTFTMGIPTINFVTKGTKVYDPRDTNTAWSDNPALCVRDYLTNTRYGRGLASSEIDDASFIVAANYCDELIDLTGAGSTVKRYTCNGLINTESGSITALKALLTSCRGYIVFTSGKYKMIMDKAETAGFAFDKTNVIGGWSISMGSKKSRFNRVNADFINKELDYRDDIANSLSATYKTNDNELILEKDISLPFNTDIERAQMLCALTLNQSRQQIGVSFIATIEALQVDVGEVVTITDTGMGWVSKQFRVERIDIKSNSEVKVSVREYDSSVYAFANVTAQDTIANTTLPNMGSVLAPTSLNTTESLYDTIGSAGVKVRVVIAWTASADKFVREYNVEWKESANSEWIFLTTTRNTSTRFEDVDPTLYDFRVRSVNTMGVRSAYTTLSNVTVNGLTTPPVDVTGLSLIALSGNAHITWDLATDLDVRVGGKVRFRHSNKTSGATWESSTDIGSAVAGHNTTAVLPLLAGTYMAKFVDSTDNESVTVTSFTATTVPNISTMNLVDTSTQHPSFTGTKTDMITADGILKFEADTLFDSFVGLMDTWTLLDAYGGLDKSGTYEFDTYIDLGRTYTSRVTSNVTFTAFTMGDYIDDRTTLMDTWSDFDNIPSDVNLDLYVTTTTDDPTSTPTWGSWAKFTVADYRARAYKFKIIATSTDVLHQINITELSVTVDMPERTERQNGLQTGASKLSVTYPSPFYALPSLGVTVVDLHSNDLLEVTNESTTGFDIGVTHGASYEDHKFNYQARGY